MNPTNSSLRRVAVGIAAILVIGGLALAQPARAVSPTETSRLEGTDRYETAVAVAKDTFPDGAPNVILATGQKFADALASSGMAGALDAPILLTLSDRLLDVTKQGLADLEAQTVYLMGGTDALSQTVEDQIVAAGYDVQRVEGDTRFGTAAAAGQVIADQGNPLTGGGIGSTGSGVTAFVTNGLQFPDAVSASPVAYAGNLPILLTAKDVIPQVTLDAIESLGIEHVVLVGGTAVISGTVRERIENETGVTTQRLAGPVRWDTNLAAVQFGVDEFDMGGETVYLSTGIDFADALVGGPAAGQNLNRLLLVHTSKVPDPTKAYIEANAANIDVLVAIGGTAAVPAAVLSEASAAAQLDSNQVYDVSPATAEGLEQSSGFSDNTGRRTFTVTGLDAGTTYDIAVLDADVVSGQGTGNVAISSFTLAQGASTAIEQVNGNPVTSGGPAGSGTETKQVEGDANSSGELTFAIDSTEQDSVVPVVWLDENADDELNLVGSTPDEPFGVGGETTWVGPEAASGNYFGDPNDPSDDPDRQTVGDVNRDANFFTGGAGTFYYSASDLYRVDLRDSDVALGGIADTEIDLAKFEGLLTSGDILKIEYDQDGQSIFTVFSDAQDDIADITASSTEVVTGGDKVRVSWTPGDQPDAQYQVYLDAGDGTADTAEPRGDRVDNNGSSVTFTELASQPGTARYVVVPRGGTTKVENEPDDPNGDAPPAPVPFRSNEIPVGRGMIGLSEGTTVSTNAGNSAANEGDVWMLSFSKAVKIASGASITIWSDKDADGDEDAGELFIFQNGTSKSTWTAEGSTAVITLGSGATSATTFTYADAQIAQLSGVTDFGGTTPSDLNDVQLEYNGPDLMPESTTCSQGETTCTLTFNEPVDAASAESTGNYAVSGRAGLSSLTLGEDGRTITLSFDTGLGLEQTISPKNDAVLTGGAVEDDDGQPSAQPPFDFVLPEIG